VTVIFYSLLHPFSPLSSWIPKLPQTSNSRNIPEIFPKNPRIIPEPFPIIPDHPRNTYRRQRDTDEMSSSGYSSTVNAEYYPVNTETMDTEDYELYDPRIHSRPRLIQNRGQPSSSRKLKEGGYELSHSTSISQNANNPSNWPRTYSRSNSISSGSFLYPAGIDPDTPTDTPLDTEDEDENIIITELDKERTPVAHPRDGPLMEYRQSVEERPPPFVAMARRPSWEDRVQRQPPTRPMSRAAGSRPTKAQAPVQPPRPASRASASSAYYEGTRPRGGFELSRSPSATSTSTIMSDVSDMSGFSSVSLSSRFQRPDPISASGRDTGSSGLKGKCPHCYIHSWLPHSPQCPRKK